jgi:hypothetical protein
MEPQAAAEIAKEIAAALENPQARVAASLDKGLEALPNKVEPSAVAEIGKGLAVAMESHFILLSTFDRVFRLPECLEVPCA